MCPELFMEKISSILNRPLSIINALKYTIPATHKDKISDTVHLILSITTIPSVTFAYHIALAADNRVATLQHYLVAPPPGIKIGDPIM